MKNEEEQNKEIHPVEQTVQPKRNEPEKENTSKQLSLQDRERLKKAIVFGMLGIAFVLSIWFIFAPSVDDKKKAEEQIGLNDDVPQASNRDLPDNKLKAYTLGTNEENENNRREMLGSLYDYFDSESEKQDNALSSDGMKDTDPVARSVNQYQETTRMLQSFNETAAYDPEKEELWNEVEGLRSKLAEMEEAKNGETDQLALMEKSYQLAAKYLSQNQQASPPPFEKAIEKPMDGIISNDYSKARPDKASFTVLPEVKNVVSALHQDVPDSVFVMEQTQERNRRFLSATETNGTIPNKNTLKVSVHETVTITNGETVRLRLLETARVEKMLIPRHKILTALAKIQGNRLMLSVTNIEQQERIVSVNLSAYGLDGQLGIFIPGSEEMNAVKEVVAGMGQNAGTSFTFSSSAGQQLAADAGKGIMQGASQYLDKKMREVKVTLKSGSLIYLIGNE